MTDRDKPLEAKFLDNPRDLALEIVENGFASHESMLIACLKYMSHDDVRDMLDANELSPRFLGNGEA